MLGGWSREIQQGKSLYGCFTAWSFHLESTSGRELAILEGSLEVNEIPV